MVSIAMMPEFWGPALCRKKKPAMTAAVQDVIDLPDPKGDFSASLDVSLQTHGSQSVDPSSYYFRILERHNFAHTF